MSVRRLTVAALRSPEHTKGEEFEAVVVLRKLATRTGRNDNPYLAVELGDRTGSFSANVFGDSPVSEGLRSATEGDVLLVNAHVEFYQGRLSPRLQQVRVLTEQDVAELGGVESLVETAPEDAALLRGRFDTLVAAIAHEPLRRTIELAIESTGENFFTAPAAVSMHHAYRSGLLEHTVHAGEVCRALVPLYPEVHADLALAGTLLHDIGKAVEYEGALAPHKTRSGQLQGHVVLGYRIVRRAGLTAKLSHDLLERLEHIILSHQGELEWGAAVMAATPEAVFVSMVDNLDAKMGMVQRALRTGGAEAEYSDYLPGLKVQLVCAKPVVPELPPPPAPPAAGASAEPTPGPAADALAAPANSENGTAQPPA